MSGCIRILLIEDNPADVELVKENMRTSKIFSELYIANDGVDALAFLRREGDFAGSPRPDIIILDLNMPRKDGRELLGDIKADKALRSIPVVVLTSSSEDQDVAQSYDLQANAYITKPLDLDGFAQIVRSIEAFWFTVVSLPQNGQ